MLLTRYIAISFPCTSTLCMNFYATFVALHILCSFTKNP